MRISDWSSDVCSSDLYPEWDLTIWGEGPMREALEQQVQDAGLAARIVLPGRTSQPWQELDKADMFALTSRVEGFPNVLLAAMALGCACVTVDCPSGPREITQDGQDDILVPLGDRKGYVSGKRVSVLVDLGGCV